MNSLQTFIEIVETMVDAHSQLLKSAKKKRNILVDGTVEELQSVIYHEQTIVERIQKLEQQRTKLLHEYMDQHGDLGKQVTVEKLLNQLDDVEIKQKLKNNIKQLRALMKEVSYLNESNQQLIQTSLSYIHYSIEMLAQKQSAIGYGPNTRNTYSNLLDAKV